MRAQRVHQAAVTEHTYRRQDICYVVSLKNLESLAFMLLHKLGAVVDFASAGAQHTHKCSMSMQHDVPTYANTNGLAATGNTSRTATSTIVSSFAGPEGYYGLLRVVPPCSHHVHLCTSKCFMVGRSRLQMDFASNAPVKLPRICFRADTP